jgi:hypothetical protein
MEPNRFFFKLIAIFLQYVLLIAIIFPLIYLAQLLKYNFKADEIYLLKILFMAIAIAMPFAVANAFSFANYEKMEITNYLKAKQKHKVAVADSSENLTKTIKQNLDKEPFWTLINQSDNSLVYKVKSLMISDQVTIQFKPQNNNQTELVIESKPVLSFIFLDFARNYRNILKVLLSSKTT